MILQGDHGGQSSLDAIRVPGSFFYYAFSLAFVAGLFCSVIPCRVLLKDLKSSFDNTPHFLFPNLYSGLCGGVA